MLIYEYKLDGNKKQSASIDEAMLRERRQNALVSSHDLIASYISCGSACPS